MPIKFNKKFRTSCIKTNRETKPLKLRPNKNTFLCKSSLESVNFRRVPNRSPHYSKSRLATAFNSLWQVFAGFKFIYKFLCAIFFSCAVPMQTGLFDKYCLCLVRYYKQALWDIPSWEPPFFENDRSVLHQCTH